ncbi:alpha/beta hydrolase family protein [Leifsonia aquatica]|uniref:alpha/beta hydrolase family protein n=1 Tax=Leifsonia aquatica TaxID=144185 RepID=UPI00384D027F
MTLFLSLLGIILGAALLILIGCTYVARRVLFPRPSRLRHVELSDDHRHLSLRSDHLTEASGRYGVWFGEQKEGHAVVGDVVSRHDQVLVREVTEILGDVPAGRSEAVWSGHVFPSPDALGHPWREVLISTELGPCPAWLFADDSIGRRTWAIHIHGRATGRVTALRGVPVAQSLGMISLVVSFRGDGEAPTAPGAACHLGSSAWEDIECAIDFAVARGASDIVLFGWSMGAAIALRASERSRHRSSISGLVLVGPVTSWSDAIGETAAQAGLPRAVGPIVSSLLETRLGARSAGASHALPMRELDWTRTHARVSHDTLVLHSPGDRDVPISSSRSLARRNPGRVELVEFAPVPHCMEWNADPERFDDVVTTWWNARFSA